MGEVYRATDSVLERPVAVKLLSEHYARDPESRARFEREALAAARLSRERHVVTVFDVGEHYGRPLIVMEYVDGGSVHDRLAQGPVPREQALGWLEQVAHALDRAHASGIVHRDVKPANLLLDRDGNVRVTDFGIASTAGLESVTLPGTVLGTAGYISPEQARGEPATPASDRYSLGVIAFELLTGRRPFEGETAATQAFAHVTAPVPSAASLAPGLPPDVDDVLARALAKDPGDRPASCAELVADLRAAFGRAGESRAPDVAPAATRVQARPPRAEPPTKVLRRRQRDRPSPGRALGAGLAARAARARSRVRRVPWGSRAGRPSAIAVSVAAILLGGLVGFALVGFGDDDAGPGRQTTREAATSPPPAETEASDRPAVDGAALNAEGFELMQAGHYEEALPILRRAVGALLGSKTLDEAYASYNLAFTRFALGSCNGVVGLLDRSERIQGSRSEIDRLRGEWSERCGGSGGTDDAEVDEGDGDGDGREGAPANGKGKGKGRGKGRGRG
jgi:serine/threonine-protein kinase